MRAVVLGRVGGKVAVDGGRDAVAAPATTRQIGRSVFPSLWSSSPPGLVVGACWFRCRLGGGGVRSGLGEILGRLV
jgi:hypothetical protein